MLESAGSDDFVRTTHWPPAVRIRTAMPVDKRAFGVEPPDGFVANDSRGSELIRDELGLVPRNTRLAITR
jgi:hypothetical protein